MNRKPIETPDGFYKYPEHAFPIQDSLNVRSTTKAPTNYELFGATKLTYFRQQFPNVGGNNVRVGLVSTGIATDHRYLNSESIVNSIGNFVGRGDYKDRVGFGTYHAGIIQSISPLAEIQNVKLIDTYGRLTKEEFNKYIGWVVNFNRYDILYIPLGSDQWFVDEFLHEVFTIAKNRGMLVVTPYKVGYRGAKYYPAEYDNVISVGQLEEKHNDIPDLWSTGKDIPSSFLDNKFGTHTGPSVSGAIVTGMLATALQYYNYDSRRLRDRIEDISHSKQLTMIDFIRG